MAEMITLLSGLTPVWLEETTSPSSCFTLDYSGLQAQEERENPIHLWPAKVTRILGDWASVGSVWLKSVGENSLRTLQEFLWAPSAKGLRFTTVSFEPVFQQLLSGDVRKISAVFMITQKDPFHLIN